MTSNLTTTARITFCIIEPTLLILGFLTPILSTSLFVSSQLPSVQKDNNHNLTPHEQIPAFQLSNLFLLIAVIGMYVLNTTTEIKVVRAFLSALWWGDLGHVGVTLWCLSWDGVRKVEDWRLVTVMNLGIPLVLFSARCWYFSGSRSGEKEDVKYL